MNKRRVKKAWWLGTMGVVAMLALAAGHCFADGEEGGGGRGGYDIDQCPVNPGTDGSGCPSSVTTSISVQSGARYRKIGLNGMPLPDEKPQHKDESDQHPEETYIDALDLTLNHNVTDIYIPLGGSADMALNIRRNVQSEVWNIKSGLKPPGSLQESAVEFALFEMANAGKLPQTSAKVLVIMGNGPSQLPSKPLERLVIFNPSVVPNERLEKLRSVSVVWGEFRHPDIRIEWERWVQARGCQKVCVWVIT